MSAATADDAGTSSREGARGPDPAPADGPPPADAAPTDAAPAPTDAAPDAPTPLRRAVTGRLLFLFILGDVLGAGIYALVGEMAGQAGGLVWLSFLVALAMALLTAFSYAELVTKYPQAGGSAVFAERAYRRPVIAFMVGFAMLCAGMVSAAGLALAFTGDYLAVFLDVPQVPAAVVFLLLVAALNAWGIKESLRANVVMTLVETAGLVTVVVLGAWVIGRGDADLGGALSAPEGTAPALAVLGSALVAFYSFVGFETSANLAEEVRDVSRVYPRALLGSLLTAGVVYVLVGFVAPAVVAPDELAESSGPLLAVVRAAGGVPPDVFAVVALVAVANGTLLTMIMASRLAYGMAGRRLLPSALSRVLPGRRTPGVAIAATTAVAIALAATGELVDLASTVVLLLLFVFLSTNVAVLVLRRDAVDHAHFRAPTALPVLAVVSCFVLLTQQQAQHWLLAGGLLAVGAVLHLVTSRAHRGAPAAEPLP